MSDGGLLGKNSSDLQKDVEFTSDGYVTGTLHYVKEYDGFSNKPTEQNGNYLALKTETKTDSPEGASVSLKYSNGPRGEVAIGEDGLVVVRVVEKNGSKGTVDIIAKRNGETTNTKTYNLDKLVLEADVG